MKSRHLIWLSGAIAAVLLAVVYYILQPVKLETSPAREVLAETKQKKIPQPLTEFHSPLPAADSVEKNHHPVQSEPDGQPEFEVSTTAAPVHYGDIVVPLGARVPAVLMDAGSSGDGIQLQGIMSDLVEEFREKILEAKRTNRNMTEAWEEARIEADERYRFFFGQDAYNAATLETASEAVEETAPSAGN